MYDPISIETALVSSSGDLLIQLTDGNIINAGRVKGEKGDTGERGYMGPEGERGTDGTNGARWHTGIGAPEIEDGADGDLYMDVASSQLPIYQKINGSWIFLANLKATPVGSGGGAAGAAGGGGSVIIFPQPDGGLPPSKDNDGKPISSGDLWYDPNTGLLWVYNGTNWLPIGDRPPVSVSPTPPLFNSSGDTNNRYPVREGDLWFDSDQAALYVAAINADDELVWVITTPADRSVLDEVVTTFRFPGSISNRAPVNGETVYNPTTELWYAYNAPKKQWIDLPPDSERILHTKLYLDAALDDTSTTAPYEAFVNTSDDETTTRLTVNRIDINDTDWSVIFKELRVGSEISLMQNYKTYDPLDPDVIVSEQLHITRYEITKINLLPNDDTADTINLEVSYLDQDADLPHQFDDDVWFIINVSLNKYVKKAGDTMTGTLEIANKGDATNLDFDPDKANLTFTTTKTDGSDSRSVSIHQNGFNSSLSITGGLVVDGSYYSESGRYYGADPSGQYFAARSPRLQLEQLEGTLQWGDSARVQWNEFNVEIPKPVENDVNGDGFIIRGTTADGYETDDALAEDGQLLSVYHNADKADAVNYAGKIANTNNLVNKGYVDDKDEELRQSIITIDEELESIAPSTERGQWTHEQASDPFRSPNSGKYFLIKGITAASDIGFAQFTEDYTEATGAVFSSTDNDGTSHTWSDVEADELIDLLDKPDPDGLFGTITEIDTSTHSSGAAIIMWDTIKSIGSPTNNEPYLTNVKIFSAPTGGTASEFVLKSGDTMSGNLIIDKSTGTADVAGALTLKGERPDDTNSAATIKFENANNSANPGYLTYKSFGTSNTFSFDRDVELNNKSFTGVGNISMIAGGNIRYSTNDRIRVNSSGGSLRYGGSGKLFWGTDGVSIEKARADNVSGSGFIVKGKIHSSSYTNSDYTDENGDLLEVFHNASGQDAINYNGKIANSRNIATKEYVDSKAGGKVDISCSTSGRAKGDMWYCTTDQALYIRVS